MTVFPDTTARIVDHSRLGDWCVEIRFDSSEESA
jgi:hypothetical protein